MKVEIVTIRSFEKEFKRFKKKFHSLPEDYKKLLNSLRKKPDQGTDLGSGFRKIRLAVKSKSKGKSGGLRVVSHFDIIIQSEKSVVTLIFVYDKSEYENVELKFIKEIYDIHKKINL